MPILTPYSSIDLLSTALSAKGYAVERLNLGGRSYTRFIPSRGRPWLTQDAHMGYPFTSKAVTKISSEKDLAYEFCAAQDIRAPKTFALTAEYTESDIAMCLEHTPLVVKPHNASLSNGVVLGIRTDQELRAAIAQALDYSPRVLVQEQVEGEEIRFTVLDGEVKAALLRQAPQLTGDGSSTIGQLLQNENKARTELTMPYLDYPELATDLIGAAGRTPDQILAAGEVLKLGRGTMIRGGASIYNVLADIHPSYLQTVAKLAKALGTRFVVVDMMLHDYTRPQTAENYAFIEFNTAPVFKLFYSCRDGKHYDIISDLVPMIDATLTADYEQ